jgi:transcriptional regulator with XRE-family HTH domain
MQNSFDRRIRAGRAYARLTQAELAERLGIGTKVLARWENGKVPPLVEQYGIAALLAKETGIDEEWFHKGIKEEVK